MIVCICHGISDKDIRQLVRLGNYNLSSISSKCNAGTDCKSCCSEVLDIIDMERKEILKDLVKENIDLFININSNDLTNIVLYILNGDE